MPLRSATILHPAPISDTRELLPQRQVWSSCRNDFGGGLRVEPGRWHPRLYNDQGGFAGGTMTVAPAQIWLGAMAARLHRVHHYRLRKTVGLASRAHKSAPGRRGERARGADLLAPQVRDTEVVTRDGVVCWWAQGVGTAFGLSVGYWAGSAALGLGQV